MSQVGINMSECGVILDLDIEGCSKGKLEGKTFVVKDLFDVEGFVTGCGNPDWGKTHGRADKTAPSVLKLLGAGAHLKGKSCTDDLALSLDGINPFFGIPLNTQLPDRIPGGSSSGSASSVATGFVDFALGTDTVGSIRVPASYCGIYGIRPTHGAIDLEGVMPLGQSFDTVAWLAPDANLLAGVGSVLLNQSGGKQIKSASIARNLFDLIPEEIAQPLLFAGDRVLQRVGKSGDIAISEYTLDLCASVFGIIRSCEAWKNFGGWIAKFRPDLSAPTLLRCTEGKQISPAEEKMGRKQKEEIEKFFDDLVDRNGAIILPTTWQMPPLRTASKQELADNRRKNIKLNALSAVSGLPQVSIPVRVRQGVKLGLSIIGPRHSDMDLLNLAASLDRRQ